MELRRAGSTRQTSSGLSLRRSLRQRIGFRPLYEGRLRTMRIVPTLGLALRERQEIRRARAVLSPLPSARVVTVIPTYRRGGALARAVRSALNQSIRDHAVLVVDDCGGGVDLPPDPRLTVITLNRHCGVAGVVRNVGIGLSRSDYIAFLDDDNAWSDDHLEVSLAEHERGAQLTYTAMRRVLPDGEILDVLSWQFDRDLLRNDQVVDTSTIVVRRKRGVLFSRVPRRRGEFPGEDWEFVFRLSRRLRTQHVPDVTVEYSINPGSYYTSWGRNLVSENR